MNVQERKRPSGSVGRGKGERGSALLIIFLFAAVVAISLYMEMPVAAFEAQRQKEQLLINRGEQYARAVKLFVRKTGRYPSSLKDLEDTNRMRFLRHQYVDPFTGKSEWRLLHAGPGGVLMDSKVNPIQSTGASGGQSGTGIGGAQNQSGSAFGSSNTASFSNNNSGAGFGNSGSGGFGNSSFGSSSAGNAQSGGPFPSSNSSADAAPDVMVQAPRQRGPAIAANGSGGTPPASLGTDADAVPSATALPPLNMQGGADSADGQKAAQANTNTPPTAADLSGTGQQPGTGQRMTATAGTDLKSSMLNNSGPSQSSGTGNSSFASSQMGTLNSGGLAGVASKAGGHSIKMVNDQSDYSLWEFYYDPRKDTTPGGVQMGAYAQQNGASPGQSTGTFGANSSSSFGQNTSSFGQNAGVPNSSGFGQQSSGFGQSTNSPSFGNTPNANGQAFGGGGPTAPAENQNSSGNQNGNQPFPSNNPAQPQ